MYHVDAVNPFLRPTTLLSTTSSIKYFFLWSEQHHPSTQSQTPQNSIYITLKTQFCNENETQYFKDREYCKFKEQVPVLQFIPIEFAQPYAMSRATDH